TYSGINAVGLKRRGFDENMIEHIEHIFRIIFVQNNNIGAAVKEVEKSIENTAFKRTILDFINCSQKGIIRGTPKENPTTLKGN
ncbi:MAG: hypothetical protein ABEH43_06240, partial [Flavobacteriales bacterium]